LLKQTVPGDNLANTWSDVSRANRKSFSFEVIKSNFPQPSLFSVALSIAVVLVQRGGPP